jgi:hypothetical protein
VSCILISAPRAAPSASSLGFGKTTLTGNRLPGKSSLLFARVILTAGEVCGESIAGGFYFPRAAFFNVEPKKGSYLLHDFFQLKINPRLFQPRRAASGPKNFSTSRARF